MIEINQSLILIIIILSVISLIIVFLLLAVLRRISSKKKYEKLDRQREFYREKLRNFLDSGKAFQDRADLIAPPQSIKWQAIEEVLLNLIDEERDRENVKRLVDKMGYIKFYEKRLKSKNRIAKASAIDKLGKMLSHSSTEKLIEVLKKENNTEIISVTIRALSRIGSPVALKGMMEQLPDLANKSLVSRKIIEASLVNFGINAIPVLIEFGGKSGYAPIKSSILEVLSVLPCTQSSCSFSFDNLESGDAEIRAKALKVLGRINTTSIEFDPTLLLPFIEDEVWFVRLQAAKALCNIRYKKAPDVLGVLLIDENWQVRNAASGALATLGNASIDVFLRTLRHNDEYARQSVCEEIEKTDFVEKLIENLKSTDKEIYEKSKQILIIMHSLKFSTPLFEYLKKDGEEGIKKEINLILHKEVEACRDYSYT